MPPIAGGDKLSPPLGISGLIWVRFARGKAAEFAESPNFKLDTPSWNWVGFVIFIIGLGMTGNAWRGTARDILVAEVKEKLAVRMTPPAGTPVLAEPPPPRLAESVPPAASEPMGLLLKGEKAGGI